MPKSFSQAVRREMNRIGTANAWLVTLDITLPDGTVIFVVNNNEDIVFLNRIYTAVNFEIDAIEENMDGSLPLISLKIADMMQAFETYMQDQEGGMGATVLFRIVNSGFLSEDYTGTELLFEVTSSKSKGGWAVFTLGVPSPYRKRLPLYRTRGNFCNWVRGYNASPRWAECGYVGELSTCDGTIEDCERHNNTARFGGHPGLVGRGMRIVY